MLSAERRNLILKEIQENKKVFVNELSRRFSVSEETIRRDLEKLDQDGFVKKGYGGAVLNEDYGTDLPFNMRYKINPEGKTRIASLVVKEIDNGDHIFMDASSTSVFISRAIKKKEYDKLTIITNSIENAVVMGVEPGIDILMTGGALRYESMSLMGGRAVDAISQYHTNKAVISCNGIDLERGITDGNDEVVSVKQAVIDASDRVILAVDSEKFGRISFAQICPLSRIDTLVTDKRPEEKWIKLCEDLNVRLVFPANED